MKLPKGINYIFIENISFHYNVSLSR